MDRVCLIGFDDPEVAALTEGLSAPWVAHPIVPRFELRDGRFAVESARVSGRMLEVSRVVFHGVFENDLDLFTALALWGGPSLPGAGGLADMRQRIPSLARAARVSEYGGLGRSWLAAGDALTAPVRSVAKWGLWHCGEDKALLEPGARFTAAEPTVVEPFVDGRAVRLVWLDGRSWQVALAGPDWLKSIHDPAAREEPVDPRLAADAERLCRAFGLAWAGVDYMIDNNDRPWLLEVNASPNVTVLAPIREAFLAFIRGWLA